MTRIGLVVVGTMLGCLGASAYSQEPGSARARIAAYEAAVLAAQDLPSGGRIEAAFNAIGPLRKVILQVDSSSGHALEAMSDAEFAALHRELGGFGVVINRVEVLYVEPDLRFFRALAARGDQVDRDFFDALHSTYQESIFPIYLQPQTDYSGCTRFGSGTLVSAYLAWNGFRREHPAHYDEASATEEAKAIEQLTDSTCACGDAASVEQELLEFIRRAPSSAERPRVEQRLAAFRSGTAGIRLGCKTG